MKRPTAKTPRPKPPKESGLLPWRVLGKVENRLHAAIKKLPLILFAFDEDGIITLSEGRGLKVLCYKPGELIGRSMYELYKNRPDILINVKRALAGESFTATSDLNGVLLETQFTPLHDVAGKFMGTIGVSIDITERKRAEEALNQQKQEQQIILDSAPALIWYKDKENKILRCNQVAAESIGLTREQMEGRSTYDLYPEQAAKYHKDDLEVIKSGKPKIGIIEEYIVASGEKRWIRTDKVPYRNEHGHIIGVIVFAIDITDQKRGEEELRRMTSELQGIFQALPDLYFRLGQDGTILDYKTEDIADLYLQPEEFMGKRMQDVLPAAVGIQFQKGIEKVLKMRSMISFEYSLQTKGGSKSFEARLSPLQDKQIVVIVRNITDPKKAMEALETQRAFFRQVIDMNPSFVFAKDRDGRFTLVNEALAEAYGVPINQLIGKTDADMNPNREEVEHFRRDDLEVMDSRSEKFIPEEVITDAAGKKHWLQTTKRPLTDMNGNVNQVLGVATDITERKQAEEALRESEKRHRLMFESNPMPMWVYDVENLQFLSVNDASIKQYGYTRQEFFSMTIKELRLPEDVPLLMRILAERPEESRMYGPIRHKKKDGTILEVELSSHRIDFAGRKARVVIVYDVTERKKAEQALLHSQKLESLGILAGGIAHDFNNLLMGVLGNSDLALQKLDPGSPIEVHLTQIKKASMRAAELCRQLLAYSGKGRFDVSFLDLNAMIKELTTLLELSIHKGITLNLFLENNLSPLLGDKVQIQQVIMNLVMNSSEAIGEKEGAINITTKKMHADHSYLSFSRFTPELAEGDYILFEVRDNGCGMDVGTLPRIFDPFFTTKFTGRGLGLAAVLGIVKGHGGALRVDSAKDEGTTFKILFPSHSSEKAAPARPSETSQPGHEDWLGRGTILVVDDEEAVRAVSELILPTLGFSALVAPDGFRACELLHAHRDDVVAVMLDLTMPKMDGVRAVQELRKIKPGIKVLLMSGYDEQEAVDHFTNEGFDCFLQKPFVRNQLREKLRSVLGGK